MIEGVKVRDLNVNIDERGRLVEVYRRDWGFFDPPPAMAYYSVSYPEVIRAWHRHKRGQVDYFLCPSGHVRIGIYDDRDGSPTRGEHMTCEIGEHCQQVVRIPGKCWHGFKVLGDERAMLINLPSKLYDHDDPDEERIPADSDQIPFDWDG